MGSGNAVELAVLDGLGHMGDGNRLRSGDIGNGARQFEHAVVSTRRQTESRDRLPEQAFGRRLWPAPAVDFARAEAAVRFLLTLDLNLMRRRDAGAHRVTRFTCGLAQQVFLGHGRYFQMNIDAVQQGAGNSAAIARHLVGRAAAAPVEMPEVAAGTGTRCSFAIRANYT